MTHLASVVGTGLTCIGFPLMSPVVLSCTFNLLAVVSSLLLSILVGWDTLMADDMSTPSSASLWVTQALYHTPNYTNVLPNKLTFMEEITLVSTLYDKTVLREQTHEIYANKWVPYENSFQQGIQSLQKSIMSPIYYNELGHRCLAVKMGPMNGDTAMSRWRQEICLSAMGKQKLLSMWNTEIQQEQKILQWLKQNNLPILKLPVLRGNHWTRFYRQWSIPVMRALLTQTKSLLQGKKPNLWEISDGETILFTAHMWQEPV